MIILAAFQPWHGGQAKEHQEGAATQPASDFPALQEQTVPFHELAFYLPRSLCSFIGRQPIIRSLRTGRNF